MLRYSAKVVNEVKEVVDPVIYKVGLEELETYRTGKYKFVSVVEIDGVEYFVETAMTVKNPEYTREDMMKEVVDNG